jgi:hypothetical protein
MRKNKEAQLEALVEENPTRPRIRSLRINDARGHNWDVAGDDLKVLFNTQNDESWAHVHSNGTTLASVIDPVQVIALDWEV